MVRRREEIEPFIPGLFDAYVSNMSLEGIWGGKTSTGVAECTSSPEHEQKTRFFCNPSHCFPGESEHMAKLRAPIRYHRFYWNRRQFPGVHVQGSQNWRLPSIASSGPSLFTKRCRFLFFGPFQLRLQSWGTIYTHS